MNQVSVIAVFVSSAALVHALPEIHVSQQNVTEVITAAFMIWGALSCSVGSSATLLEKA